MYIVISEDIVKNALDKYSCSKDLCITIMTELALGAFRGHHFVYIENYKKYKNNLWSAKILTRQLMAGVERGSDYEGKSIVDKIKIFAVVSLNDKDYEKYKNQYPNHQLIWINPNHHKTLELSEETHLLTENLNDGKFFKPLVIRHLKRKCKLGNFNVSYLNRNGGGATTADVYADEIKKANHFCLVITDSDKKHPDDTMGKTAESIKDKRPSTYHFAAEYFMEEVMEVENLIPRSFLPHSHNWQKELIKKDLSYYDIKLGLSLNTLAIDKYYNYWLTILGNQHLQHTLRDYQIRLIKEDPKTQIVKGWGEGILKNFLDKNDNIDNLEQTKDNQLTESQIYEWDAIGQKVIDWCIAIKPSRC